MATVTHDARSFMLDGRRIWLASGSMSYARVPREAWRDRVYAAKFAGLNALEVPVFWNRHEPRPGKLDFKGENDLRHFIEIIGHAGMYCILRIGPFVGDGWDMGGLPPWLLEKADVRLRTQNNIFLEACSRFIGAVADQVRDKQITAPGDAGPIVLIELESDWTCGTDAQSGEYLGELNRYLRESGLNCPVVNANNLWQSLEGAIDAWTGTEEMLASMRQLTTVRSTQPRLVIGFHTGNERVWGQPDGDAFAPFSVQRRLAEILAGGGQFNIRPFIGGTYAGFFGGRTPQSPASFVTPAADQGSAVLENGAPTPSYYAIRRIAHFASRFSRVFAHLDPTFVPVAVDPYSGGQPPPSGGGKKSKATAVVSHTSVVNAVGQQGSVAFVFGEEPPVGGELVTQTVTLLMPDGSTLPVTLREQSVAWCLFGVHVNGRALLDHCNLNAFAAIGQVFVAFGPAGSRALLSVNGSPLDVTVPTNEAPLVITHEGLTLVILAEHAIDHTFVTDHSVLVNVQGVSADGHAIPRVGEKHYTRIDADGKVTRMTPEHAKPAPAASERVSHTPWTRAAVDEYRDGTSPRYAVIDGPADLTSLGCPFGYGWYRLTLNSSSARKARVVFPQAGDRLHVFLDGEPMGVVGEGPGATHDTTLSLKKGEQRLVILAENLGRFSGGSHLGERKGLFGHAWEHVPLKVNKPKLVRSEPIDLLSFQSPMWEVRDGDATLPDRLTWSIPHRKKTPLIMHLDNLQARALLIINDKPIMLVDRAGPRFYVIDPEQLGRGTAEVQLAFLPEVAGASEEFGDAITFSEGEAPLSAKAEFAFAKWETPAGTAFAAANKAGGKSEEGPAWWRTTFKVGTGHAPLYFEPAGLTKGQLFVNGHHISRYFVATGDRKSVPPQERYYIPDSRLLHGRENELVVFDEHGAQPGKSKLSYDASATPIKA